MLARKTITLGGEPRECEFGMAMFMLYEEQTGKPYGEWIGRVLAVMQVAEQAEANGLPDLSGMAISPVVDAAYYAMRAAAELDGRAFDVPRLRVASWLNGLDALGAVLVGFVGGIPRKSDDEAQPAESDAKKKTAKAPSRTP